MSRVLVAEDDPKQARLIRIYLERDGHSVIVVENGHSALEIARERKPDLVLLDVMMPGMDGLDVCRILREQSAVPILLVTARTTEADILTGLDLGADDYVTKPFSPRELAARVRALLRRSSQSQDTTGTVRAVGDLIIDPTRFEVRVGQRLIVLTPKEFAILQTLSAEPGRAYTRAQIIDSAFGFDSFVLGRTVDAHVMNLRRKLGDDPAEPRYIQTVPGRGYRLLGSIGET
jgi:DNA-binding response OmpR family regulator